MRIPVSDELTYTSIPNNMQGYSGKVSRGPQYVFYVIDQNVKIFRGFVNHRPYFRQFSKKKKNFQKTHRL